MAMRWCLYGLILSFSVSLQTADSRPTTPISDLTVLTSTLPLIHPSPMRYTNTLKAGGSEAPSLDHTAMPSPARGAVAASGPNSPQKATRTLFASLELSPKRSCDDGQEEQATLPGSAGSTTGSPKRSKPEDTRPQSTPVGGPCRIAAIRTLFATPEDRSTACSSGYASVLPHATESPSDNILDLINQSPSGRSSSSSLLNRMSKLSQRRVSDPFVTAVTPEKSSSASLSGTPGSPASYAWPEAGTKAPTPTRLTWSFKGMDIHNPSTTSIEYQALVEEETDLRQAINISPANTSETLKLQNQWADTAARKQKFEQQFIQAAQTTFNPRISQAQQALEQHQKNPTYAGAVDVYNRVLPLEEELTQWSGTSLYTHLTDLRKQTANYVTAAETIEKAAGTKHQQALAVLLEKNTNSYDFDSLVSTHEDALHNFRDDIQTAHQSAKVPRIKHAFEVLKTETANYFTAHSTAGRLALCKQDNPGPTWKDYLHTVTKGPAALIGGRLRKDVGPDYSTAGRTRRRSSSTDSVDHQASRRTRYDSGCKQLSDTDTDGIPSDDDMSDAV